MKKVIMLTSALILGVSVQAASFAWSYVSNAADAGSTVYVLLGQPATSFDALSGITDLSASSGVLTTGARNTSTKGSVSIAGDAGSITSADFYYVVVNSAGTGYWISGNQSAIGSLFNDGETGTTLTFKNSGAALSYDAFSSGGGEDPVIPVDPPVGPGGEGGVPEPTSGLLLIVGGSLLALRRKQK